MADRLAFDCDFAVIGSGFGGSVSAMRLAEKGWNVLVIEQGRRFGKSDFPRTNWDLRRYLWAPILRCFGIQRLTLFKNVFILSGAGVGGGSLVYANTLLQPGDEFFSAPAWRSLADWKAELLPRYEVARRMLGVTPNPRLGFTDRMLQDVAHEMGRGGTFRTADLGVYFGESGRTVPDPYFGGTGPDRTGCNDCGGCMVGCRFGAKNTLDRNYLYFAEKFGARILPETRVRWIRPIRGSDGREDGSSGWEIAVEKSTALFFRERRIVRAREIVLSGGVLGTVDLLLRCKHQFGTLPSLSDRLGASIRTNSEALVGVTEFDAPPEKDYSVGAAITSIFHADEQTHIEPVRYSRGSNFMKLLAAPMVDEANSWLRPLKLLFLLASQPLRALRMLVHSRWAETSVILLAMQTVDNRMRFRLGRSWTTLFRRGMVSAEDPGAPRVPAYIPIANQVARLLARRMNGYAQSAVNEVVLNIPTTAHVLGGCPIGADASTGVVDSCHRVFGYEGLRVCDGSVIPANLGVNPSLTITAMSERAMSFVPANPECAETPVTEFGRVPNPSLLRASVGKIR
jgi:cholesterol oxidase